MSQIAIDIVLLPPSDIMDQAIAINKQFSNDPIQLNKTDCLPHISLCTGVVRQKDIERIRQIIDDISKGFTALSLTIENIHSRHFSIKRNKDLQKLHELIMGKLDGYLTYQTTPEMFISPPAIDEQSLLRTNNFREHSGFENFRPHITLVRSKLEDKELSINFTTSQIAICHLGNYCTCRKILYTTELK